MPKQLKHRETKIGWRPHSHGPFLSEELAPTSMDPLRLKMGHEEKLIYVCGGIVEVSLWYVPVPGVAKTVPAR